MSTLSQQKNGSRRLFYILLPLSPHASPFRIYFARRACFITESHPRFLPRHSSPPPVFIPPHALWLPPSFFSATRLHPVPAPWLPPSFFSAARLLPAHAPAPAVFFLCRPFSSRPRTLATAIFFLCRPPSSHPRVGSRVILNAVKNPEQRSPPKPSPREPSFLAPSSGGGSRGWGLRERRPYNLWSLSPQWGTQEVGLLGKAVRP